ncbi:MAG: hypothetical protein ACREI8_13895 [Myxococcota bacterium]
MLGARRRLAAAGAVYAISASGCALPAARWDVASGSETRFAETQQLCRQLTAPSPERFEDCMGRRGFARESLFGRSWRALTGG